MLLLFLRQLSSVRKTSFQNRASVLWLRMKEFLFKSTLNTVLVFFPSLFCWKFPQRFLYARELLLLLVMQRSAVRVVRDSASTIWLRVLASPLRGVSNSRERGMLSPLRLELNALQRRAGLSCLNRWTSLKRKECQSENRSEHIESWQIWHTMSCIHHLNVFGLLSAPKQNPFVQVWSSCFPLECIIRPSEEALFVHTFTMGISIHAARVSIDSQSSNVRTTWCWNDWWNLTTRLHIVLSTCCTCN